MYEVCPVVELSVFLKLLVVGVCLLGGEVHEVAECYVVVGSR